MSGHFISEAPHKCNKPVIDREDDGRLWECDECGRRWRPRYVSWDETQWWPVTLFRKRWWRKGQRVDERP